MHKKILLVGAIFAVSSSIAFANAAPYMGFSVSEKTNTAPTSNYRGVPGNLFLGYGGMLGTTVYLAGELSATIGSATIMDNGLKSSYGYSFSLLPGISLSDHTMIYGRLGVEEMHFTPSGTSSASITGGLFGVGLQTDLMQSWDLRGEYIYHAYGRLSQISASPRSDEFSLGLLYKFE